MMRAAALLAVAVPALVAAGRPAAAKSIRFRSEVSPAKWSATIRGTLTYPSGKGPFPVVIFLHPCSGWKSAARAGAEAHASYLRKHGFATLILDSFGPRGLNGTKACAGSLVKQAPRFVAYDAFNAMTELGKSDSVSAENVFLVGQSLGANAALIAALESYTPHKETFRAVVALYPYCGGISPVSALRSPLLILAGGRDNWTPSRRCSSAKEVGRWDSGPEFNVIVYPKAQHGFDQPRKGVYRFKKYTVAYSPAAAADAREKMTAFFVRHLTDDLKARPFFTAQLPQ